MVLFSLLEFQDKDELLRWLVEQRSVASIEEVRDAMLEEIVEENEFVAVLFMGLCAEDEEEEEEEDQGGDDGDGEESCSRVLSNLERIDSALDEFGIVMVRTHDVERAQEELWISR